MNGVVFHTSTMTTVQSAVSGLAVQVIGAEIRPMRRSMSLITPNWSWSIQFHILAETTVGIAQGMRMMARMMPAARERRVEDQRDDHARAPSRWTPTRERTIPCSRPSATSPGSVRMPSHSPS